MKLSVSKFEGLKPVQDQRTPNSGLAVVCQDASLRHSALAPFPKPEDTAFTVTNGSSRLLFDPRRQVVVGGSVLSGSATETFPDSQLLYVFDPLGNNRVIDGTGHWLPIVPLSPQTDSGGDPMFTISNIATQPITALDGIGMSHFETNLRARELQDSNDVTHLQDNILRIAAQLPLATTPWVDAVSFTELLLAVITNSNAMPSKLNRSATSSTLYSPPAAAIANGLKTYQYMYTVEYADLYPNRVVPNLPYVAYGQAYSDIRQIFAPGATPATTVFTEPTQRSVAALGFGEAVTEYVLHLLPDRNASRAPPTTVADTANLYGSVLWSGGAYTDTNQHVGGAIGFYRPTLPVVMIPAVIDKILHETGIVIGANVSAGPTYDLWETLQGLTSFWVNAVSEAFRSQSAGVATPAGGVPGMIVPFKVGTTEVHDMTEDWSAPIPRAYCYTWVDIWGRESTPSLPVVKLGTNDVSAQAPEHSITVTEPPPADASGLYVYRAVSSPYAAEAGKVDSRFLRCTFISVSSSLVNVPLPPYDEAIGYELNTQEYVPTPADASFVRETQGGYLVWATQDRTVVQLSLRHIWYATHPSRWIQLPQGWKVMGIEPYGDDFHIITDHKPIFVQPMEDKGPAGMRIDVNVLYSAPSGCLRPESICNTEWGAAYSSPTGFVVLHGNRVMMPLTGMYDPDDWLKVSPDTCAAYWDGRYFGFKADSCIVIDLPDPQMADGRIAAITTLSSGATAALADPYGYFYILPTGSPTIQKMYLTGDVLPYVYKTTVFPYESQTLWTTLYIAGTGDDVAVKFWNDDRLILDRVVPLNTLVRIRRHAAGFKGQLELRGTARINEVTLSTTGTENISFRGHYGGYTNNEK